MPGGSHRIAEAFVIAEVEQLVADNASRDGGAELLEQIVGFGQVTEIGALGIHTGIAAVGVGRAMRAVGARFQSHVDYRSLLPAKFRAGVGHDVDFLNRVQREYGELVGTGRCAEQRPGRGEGVDIVYAIEHPHLGENAGPIGGIRRSVAAGPAGPGDSRAAR